MNYGGLVQKLWGFAQVSNWMKWGLVFLSLPIFVLQTSCQRRNDKWEPGKGFRTQIIVSKSFGTSFQQVELKGVRDKSSLAGEVVDFYFAPGDTSGQMIGNKPVANFIEDDGVYVPANQTTLQMVTLYYHLQQLKELELQALDTTKSILQWPRKVALSVRVLNSPDMRFDNAFYNSKIDALYFVPYKESAFPIPLNPGIVAHEHFHSYFSYEVMRPLMAKKLLPTEIEISERLSEQAMKALYDVYVLKIINEGLADVWGWIYSEDPDFVSLSLPKVNASRNLEKGADHRGSRLATETDLKTDVQMMVQTCFIERNGCYGEDPYGHGTILARTMKSFSAAYKQSMGTSETATRKLMAGKILHLIAAIQDSFASGAVLTLDRVVTLWEKQFDSLSESECQVLQAAISTPGAIRCASNAVLSAP